MRKALALRHRVAELRELSRLGFWSRQAVFALTDRPRLFSGPYRLEFAAALMVSVLAGFRLQALKVSLVVVLKMELAGAEPSPVTASDLRIHNIPAELAMSIRPVSGTTSAL